VIERKILERRSEYFTEYLTPEWWNSRFQITFGDKIVASLMMFECQPLRFQPPIRGIESRLKNMLPNFKIYPSKFEIVSFSKLQGVVAQLPVFLQEQRIIARITLRGMFVANFSANLSPHIRARINLEKQIFENMAPEIIPAPWAGVADNLRFSLREMLRCYITFLIAEKPDQAQRVDGFISLFRQGNFPFGLLGDGTFLVLVA